LTGQEEKATPSTPAVRWFQDAVFYMLPVRSFVDANGDGVGDFEGLISRLDHIQDLGATCIWLLPFFPSPLHDDGYDVTDYRDVRSTLGIMGDVRGLIDEAHRRGLRVAAEMVINHTSDEHPWFQASRAAPVASALRDFYIWSDRPDRFGSESQRSNWTWDPVAGQFYWHRFSSHQPDLNYDNPAVIEEIKKILRFWAEAGMDGLCLNGSAYLVEREGRGFENLPETHNVLRQLRRSVIRDYPDLMLQAGVSAWPEVAASYFGDGDECDMAPHLALAPRLFFSLQQEDCRPLVELLSRTPTPPAGCQWVTLLRNHDELTLTLATDEERDYLFTEYAVESSMRRNGGILRRLAPLAEFNRRKVELLYGLLLALPGAPVIYYGDEIGMGDNVFLSGRAGVRTPMQWTGDRNAGFSKADPSRLDAPVVSDPLGGHQAVNVEAQQRDSSSLLHWLRRHIALRRSHVAFSRGSIEILEPSAGAVLSLIRRAELQGNGDEAQTVLVVANLARTTQSVRLDLSGYQGLTPVEMLGGSSLPRIEDSLYHLTLPPFAFYWLQLEREPRRYTRLVESQVEAIARIPVIEWDGNPDSIWSKKRLAQLATNILPDFLRSQRWFGGKARSLASIDIVEEGVIVNEEQFATRLLLLKVAFTDGREDLYTLPIAVVQGEPAAQLARAKGTSIIARLAHERVEAILIDALATDAFPRAILESIRQDREFNFENGVLKAQSTSAFARVSSDRIESLRVIQGPATSSNSFAFFGRQLLFKQFRRLEAGVNPDVEVGLYLTENHHFKRTPQTVGVLEYRSRGEDRAFTFGIVQTLVPNQGDGWSHALSELSRYYDRASARMFGPDVVAPDPRSVLALSALPPSATALEVIAGYIRSAETLGQRTAEMHLAFAEGTAADFEPSSLTAADLDSLAKELEYQTSVAIPMLNTYLPTLPAEIEQDAKRLLSEGAGALERTLAAMQTVPQGMKTRIHGDYHLGQVLWTDNDYVILDFEGEPTRTVDERREKFSPLRDVAGMLRSYHYAAYAGLFAFTEDQPDDLRRLVPWAELWQQWVSAAFLARYRRVAAQGSFLPPDDGDFGRLLNGYMLAKALYELAYELNNRPDWVRIPLGGVLQLLGLADTSMRGHR